MNVAQLLGRDEVVRLTERAAQTIDGARVLVTGAGGSIGSEICRKIVSCSPEKLIMAGRSELGLFETSLELRKLYSGNVSTHLIDICSLEDTNRLFLKERPTVVIHCAAHKHVPLCEANPEQAIKNNVIATWNVATLSHIYSVGRFVYISTDKAVNPTSVMGATKRAGEIIALAHGGVTSVVRFGNVIGSSGSVIPIFQKQIDDGGPVTVTHPDMTRYFMTIPEAASLVLESLAFGGFGQTYVLDMGKQVKIADLAKRMIEASGKNVEIEYTGIRPGEKLVEELGDAFTTDTSIPKIKSVFVKSNFCHPKKLIHNLIETPSVANLIALVPEYVRPT
jgi:FlaA1/EpsC-like NDP-sugar epimerase